MTTPRLIKSIGRSPLRLTLLLIPLLFACFANAQSVRAVSPPPDGGYPGGNTAEGQLALGGLTTGIYNTGVGIYSLLSLTDGNNNTAVGAGALLANTADSNTAIGAGALFSHTNGIENTAIGTFALFNDIAGQSNIAIGANALLNNDIGGSNTAIGGFALMNNTSGINNVALGGGSGGGVTTANDVICIGTAVGGANVDHTCFIGNIRDVTTQNADAIPVVIDSSGQLGTASSSRRFKKEIKPMDKTSEAILTLNPVTFRYKSGKTDTAQFGLIAEEVAKVNPDLVVRDKNGDIYTVRYDAVNAMLLNEFLKEHQTVQQQGATIARLEKQIDALTAGLRKVSAQLEVSKPAPQTVLNNQ